MGEGVGGLRKARGTSVYGGLGLLYNLGRTYDEMGRWDDAEKALRRGFELCMAELGSIHTLTQRVGDYLAGLYEDKGQSDRSRAIYEQLHLA